MLFPYLEAQSINEEAGLRTKSGFFWGWVEMTEAGMGILGCKKRNRLGSIKYGGPQKTTEMKRNPKDLEAISAGFTIDHIALFHVQRM